MEINFNDLKIISIHDKFLIVAVDYSYLSSVVNSFIVRYSFCRLTMSVVVLLLLCGGLHLSLGEKLKCQFEDRNFFSGNEYHCSVTSLDNSLNNMTIDGFTGVHRKDRTDNNVKGISIHDTNTKYIPANLGILFNLTFLLVHYSNLIEIKAENFQGMLELQYLNLYGNKLTSLASSTFSTVAKLEYLSLVNNQIEVIPSNLFSNNLNLEKKKTLKIKITRKKMNII